MSERQRANHEVRSLRERRLRPAGDGGGAVPARPGDALRAEWTKWRTTSGGAWLLFSAVVLTVGVSAAASAAAHCPSGGCPLDPGRISLTGIQLGQAVVAILGVLSVSGEYSTRMIHVTLAAMPRRTTVLAAKAAILAGTVAAAGTVAVLASLAAGRLILPGHGFTAAHGYPSLSLGDATVVRAAVGSVLYLALIAVLSLGTATAVRDSATAVGVVLGLLYLFPILTQAQTDPHWKRHLQQLAPTTAGLNVQATMDLHSLPIGPWAGLGVLAAWAAGTVLLGGWLLRSRDA